MALTVRSRLTVLDGDVECFRREELSLLRGRLAVDRCVRTSKDFDFRTPLNVLRFFPVLRDLDLRRRLSLTIRSDAGLLIS